MLSVIKVIMHLISDKFSQYHIYAFIYGIYSNIHPRGIAMHCFENESIESKSGPKIRYFDDLNSILGFSNAFFLGK